MPFLVQTLRKTHLRLQELEARTEPPKEDDNAQDAIANTYGNLGGFGGGLLMIENGGGIPMPTATPTGAAGIDMSGFGVGMPPQMGMMPAGGMQGMPGM